MAVLKSYTCSKCAGILYFDSDQDFFDCPFCGTKYDIIDFHGGEVMDQAKECLGKKSYDAAKDKYLAVLEKEPENFDAWLGNLLCELRIQSVEELKDRSVISRKNLTQAKKLLVNVKDKMGKNENAYFKKIYDLLIIHEELCRLENEKREISSETTKGKINDKLREIVEEPEREKDEKKQYWIYKSIIIAITLICATVAIAIQNFELVMYIMFGIFIVFIIAFTILRALWKAKEEARFKPATIVSQEYNRKIATKTEEYEKAFSELNVLYPATQRIKKMRKAEETRKFSDSDIDPDKVIICSKCAAQLHIDKNKRVYQCDHCGVAYGVSLFFGLSMEKALDAMNSGHYSEAEQRFENILMINPLDFESHLGIILCKGRWAKISDIDLTDDISVPRERGVKTSIAQALEHSSDEDRPYFEKIENLIGLLDKYASNVDAIYGIKKEIEDFEAKAAVYSIAFYSEEDKKKREDERNALVKKTYPYQVENKKITEDFNSLRNSILGMRSDSVLAK